MIFKKELFLISGIISLVILMNSASAYSIEDLQLEGSYGTGSNTAYVVVDFAPYNGQEDSFAFEAAFDGTIDGIQLLDVIADNESRFSYSAPGGFMNDVWYTDSQGTQYHSDYVWTDTEQRYWGYWVSDDLGESWGYSGSGADGTDVTDGDTNGWLALPGDDYTSTPVTPVPEPASIVVLSLGTLLVFRKKHK